MVAVSLMPSIGDLLCALTSLPLLSQKTAAGLFLELKIQLDHTLFALVDEFRSLMDDSRRWRGQFSTPITPVIASETSQGSRRRKGLCRNPKLSTSQYHVAFFS
jgi:hypothetical protein